MTVFGKRLRKKKEEKPKKEKATQAKHKIKQKPTTPIWGGAMEKPNIGERGNIGGWGERSQNLKGTQKGQKLFLSLIYIFPGVCWCWCMVWCAKQESKAAGFTFSWSR